MKTPLSFRHGFSTALATTGLLLAAAATAQQAPPSATSGQATNLGTLVVAPSNAPAAKTHAKGVRIHRSSLNLNVNAGAQSSPPPAQHRTETTPPRPLHMTPPTYPASALAKGAKGSVEVGFTVKKNGHTGNIHVIQAKPPGLFDAAARRAVRQWRFQPATRGGQPVARKVTQTINFNPPPGAAPAGKPSASHPSVAQKPKPKPPANRVPDNVKPVHVVPPQYPSRAYRNHQGGRVTVRFVVRPNGHTGHITVVSARPSGVFNRAAINAVRQWRFQPVSKPTVVVQTITFNPPGG